MQESGCYGRQLLLSGDKERSLSSVYVFLRRLNRDMHDCMKELKYD